MYKVVVTRQDGTFAESMTFSDLENASAWAQWQEDCMNRIVHILSL